MQAYSRVPQPWRPLRVLAIEDDADIQEFYRTFLREAGHEVRLARSGIEGLRQLDWAPDVILLDLTLPGMDGYEFLRHLRTSPKGVHLPVLVLSAALSRDRTTLPGAQLVLKKPFDFDHLLAEIERYGNRPTGPVP